MKHLRLTEPAAFAATAYALLLSTAFLWAGNAVAGKFAVGHISPFLLTTLRWLVAVIVLAAIAGRHIRADFPTMRANAGFLALLGGLGFTAFNALFYLALNYTSAINVAIEQSAMPLVVFLLNFLLFSIRTTPMQIAGFLLTLAGVIFTATRGAPWAIASSSVNIGDLMMIVAISLYGVYSVLLSRRPKMHILSFLFAVALAALLTAIPLAVIEAMMDRTIWPDARGWGVTIFTALGPALVAQLAWAKGLEMIGSNRGGIFINIVPVFAAILAVLVLGERFEAYHGVAMILVISGVWLAQAKPR